MAKLSLLQFYQLARSGKQSKPFLAYLDTALKSEKALQKLGIPAWQFRWLLKHLEQASTIDPTKIQRLRTKFDSKYWPGIFENYLNGPTSDFYFGKSAAVFALDPDSDRLKPHLRKILRQMKKEIIEIDSVRGWTMGHEDQDRIDLGTAHGITGSTLALSLISKRLGADPQITSLSKTLETSFEKVFKKGPIEITRVVPQDPNPSAPKRIGWCRSDLSSGIALVISGRRLQSPKLKKLGLKFLDRTKKSSPAKLATDNPYLCHGAAGNAYMLALAFELTGERWFVNRSIKTLETTQRFVNSEKFPLHAFGVEYHLMDLRNCSLVEGSIKHGLDTSWDIIFGFRDPYDLSLF